jgi:ribonuclease HI
VAAWLGEGKQTNQRAELAAIKRAVDLAPINRNVLIRSDSHYAIQCVTVWFQRWEANGWKTAGGKSVDNRDLVEPILERIRERLLAGGQTRFEWVKGHSTDAGNIAADSLAVQGAEIGRQLIAAGQAGTTGEARVQEDIQGDGEDPEAEGSDEEWAWVKQLKESEQQGEAKSRI